MQVVTVAPLTRGSTSNELTYYTATECPVGTIVKAPVRGREIHGLVIAAEPVSHTKTTLKAATFTLRKLPTDPIVGAIPHSLTTLTRALYTHYPTTLGALLFALLPSEVRNGTLHYPTTTTRYGAPGQETGGETQTLVATTDERYIYYQSQIRTTFAQQRSVLMVVPTAAEATYAATRLTVGIQDRFVLLHSNQTARQRRQSWQKAHDNTQPILIITTPSYAYIERPDTTLIIIERSAHSSFRSRTRPYLDHTFALQTLSQQTGRECLLADTVIRSEVEQQRRTADLPTASEVPKRLCYTSRLQVIRQVADTTGEHTFQHLLPEVVERLSAVLAKRENVFLYAPRRGLAPVIACLDCGTLARCPASGNPYSLVRSYKNGAEERWFVDTASGTRVRAADTCTHCGSWRLRERGVGIQQLENVIPDYFPNIPVITFDAATARTPKQTATLHHQILTAKGSIILGTAIAIPFLPPTISHTCVTSLEAAASIPSWRADEFFFRLLLELREKTKDQVLLQARHQPGPIVDLATQGAIEKFYDEELALREQLHYPPFATLILLSWKGSREFIAKTEVEITTLLSDHQPHCYSHPLSDNKASLRHCLIRIPGNRWPEEALLQRLRSLPPHIKIQIDPDQIV